MASYCGACVHDGPHCCTHSFRHRRDEKVTPATSTPAVNGSTARPAVVQSISKEGSDGVPSRLSSPKRTVTEISLDRQREDRNTQLFSISLRGAKSTTDPSVASAQTRRTPSPSPKVFLQHHAESIQGSSNFPSSSMMPESAPHASDLSRTVPFPPQFNDAENIHYSNESPRRKSSHRVQYAPSCTQCEGMRRYIDLLRDGFSKLCAAVTDDIYSIREETNAKIRAMESNLMNAVSDAVRQERRYQTLLRNETFGESESPTTTTATTNAVYAQVDAIATDFKAWQSDMTQTRSEIRHLSSDVELIKSLLHNKKAPQVSDVGSPSFASILRDVTKHFDETIDARIRAETSPLSLHVRSLTNAQHQLAQTVAEEEGRRVEHALSQRISKLEAQLAEVKARVRSQGEEQRESIYALCNAVPVAAPL